MLTTYDVNIAEKWGKKIEKKKLDFDCPDDLFLDFVRDLGA